MKKNVGVSMILIALIALSGVVYTFATDTKPTLGLDLAGGVSVVMDLYLDGEQQTDVPQDNLDKTIDIIRKRVDAIGVAEPEISSQGSSILVQIPGIDDQDRALELMGRTAELRFRPVLSETQSQGADPERVAELKKLLKIPENVTAAQVFEAETGIDPTAPTTTAAPSTTAPSLAPTIPPAAQAPAVTADPLSTVVTTKTSETTPSGDAAGARIAGRFGAATRGQDPTTTATTAAPATTAPTTAAPTTAAGGTATTVDEAAASTTTTIKNEWGVDINSGDFIELYQAEQAVTAQADLTKPEDDQAGDTVTLPNEDGSFVYKLGPVYEANGAKLTGTALSGASAGLGGTMGTEWAVYPEFKSGAAGIDLFNAAAKQCYDGEATCPVNNTETRVGQLAITLDGEVLTAPSINSDDKLQGKPFEPYKSGKSGLQISGAFTEQTANDVATALKFGALPYELRPSSAQEVSATLGAGALKAALIAGAVGLALVALYMLFYYRVLGMVTIFGLAISGGILWTFISLIGASLTLSGIVGIIVSIGISLDSNVVFFENLKEDVRGGRSLRSTVGRSFSSAFSTIVKADVSSLLGAGVLFALTAGPVKGFAAYLFLTTAIDIVISWFWMRPATAALAGSSLGSNPAAFGILMDAPVTRRSKSAPSTVADSPIEEEAADASPAESPEPASPDPETPEPESPESEVSATETSEDTEVAATDGDRAEDEEVGR